MQETVFGLRINVREKDSLFYVTDSKFSIFEQDYRIVSFNDGYSDFGKPYFLSKETNNSTTFDSYKEYLSSIGMNKLYARSSAYKYGLNRLSGMFYKDEFAVEVVEIFKLIRGSKFVNILNGRWFEYKGLSKNNHTLKLIRSGKSIFISMEYVADTLFIVDDTHRVSAVIAEISNSGKREVEFSQPTLILKEIRRVSVKDTTYFSIISRNYSGNGRMYAEKIPGIPTLYSAEATISVLGKNDTDGFVSTSGVEIRSLLDSIGFSQAFAIIAVNSLTSTGPAKSEFSFSIRQ